MRVLVLIVALFSLPAFAADYTPWPAQKETPLDSLLLAQTIEEYCCKHCARDQKPCGRDCISEKAMCSAKPGGCACPHDAP